MISPSIYLDYQATTPIDPRVLDAMLPFFTDAYGNPSSPHAFGRQAADAVRTARGQILDLIGARTESEIIFTSGATEADHLAIAGVAAALQSRGDHIVTTAIEHKAVLASCEGLTRQGFWITHVPVDNGGLVNPTDVADAITDHTVLVSVMHANNEIGTIQPITEIGRITRERGVLLHTDAAQSLGTVPFNVDSFGADLASFSAHKVYGPKGVGALYIRRGIIRPLQQLPGGGQEFGLRAGTLNVPGIIGFGAAAAILADERQTDARHIRELRDRLLRRLQTGLPRAYVNGSMSQRLPGNISITVPEQEADQILSELSGVAVSTGSACSTGGGEPSHVLTAIGLSRPDARATLRIGIGRPTTVREIDFAAERLIEALS